MKFRRTDKFHSRGWLSGDLSFQVAINRRRTALDLKDRVEDTIVIQLNPTRCSESTVLDRSVVVNEICLLVIPEKRDYRISEVPGRERVDKDMNVPDASGSLIGIHPHSVHRPDLNVADGTVRAAAGRLVSL